MSILKPNKWRGGFSFSRIHIRTCVYTSQVKERVHAPHISTTLSSHIQIRMQLVYTLIWSSKFESKLTRWYLYYWKNILPFKVPVYLLHIQVISANDLHESNPSKLYGAFLLNSMCVYVFIHLYRCVHCTGVVLR